MDLIDEFPCIRQLFLLHFYLSFEVVYFLCVRGNLLFRRQSDVGADDEADVAILAGLVAHGARRL